MFPAMWSEDWLVSRWTTKPVLAEAIVTWLERQRSQTRGLLAGTIPCSLQGGFYGIQCDCIGKYAHKLTSGL